MADAIAATTVFIIVFGINISLMYRRRNQGIKSLDQLIMVFSSLTFMAIAQLLHTFVPGLHPPLDVDSSVSPVIVDVVRIFNYLFIILLYIFIEYILNDSVNRYRSAFLIITTATIIVVGAVDLSRGILILTSDIFPFGADERLDELVFDLSQFFVIVFATYVFKLQNRFSTSKELKRYSILLFLAGLLYSVAMLIEVLEHFLPFLSIDAFMSAIPTTLMLGYVYIFNPRYVYLVPTEIKFMQIVDRNGTTIYAAEFKERAEHIEFLVGPGLFSISSMIGELVESSEGLRIDSINHSEGRIMFVHHKGLIGVVQTTRESRFLKESLRYFLSEFARVYHIEDKDFKGTLIGEVSPDTLLIRCVPIVESKPIISQITKTQS